jgi:hypothetical protein
MEAAKPAATGSAAAPGLAAGADPLGASAAFAASFPGRTKREARPLELDLIDHDAPSEQRPQVEVDESRLQLEQRHFVAGVVPDAQTRDRNAERHPGERGFVELDGEPGGVARNAHHLGAQTLRGEGRA